MKSRRLALAASLVLAGCTYHSGGDGRTDISSSTPATPSAAPAPSDAKSPGYVPAKKPSAAVANSPIKGLELFDRQVTVITVVCSSHTYDLDYSGKAAASLMPKPGGGVTKITRVDVSLRCHPKGFANFESRCYASAEIAMSVAPASGAGNATTLVAKGEGDAGAGALCEGGAEAVNHAMDIALAEAGKLLGR